MARKRGELTRKWAEGLGRQSGALALSAAAVAGLPFLDLIRPACGASAACEENWARLFFLPDLLFMPAVLLAFVLVGSWFAQRGHEKFHAAFYAKLAPTEVPEIPPGHHNPAEIERDLIWRTMRWSAIASFLSIGLFSFLATTPIGRRACDPIRFSQPTGLQMCSGPTKWSDALIAYEVWLVIIIAAIWGIAMAMRARRFRAKKNKGRRRLPGLGKAKQDATSQAHP